MSLLMVALTGEYFDRAHDDGAQHQLMEGDILVDQVEAEITGRLKAVTTTDTDR